MTSPTTTEVGRDRPDLEELAARVERGTGADRELDREIHFRVVHPWLAEKAVKWVPAAFEPEGSFIWWTAERLADKTKEGFPDQFALLTDSLDAVVRLIEEKLPGRSFAIELFVRDGKWSLVPRILLAAALRAMKEEGR